MKKVGIIMGSKSDLPVMQDAIDILNEFGIESELNIVSAHRTPEKMFKYASDASDNGIKVIIAGAGGAAHLPGMVASITTLPVIGVPVKSRNSIDGWDSVLSILQMPNGVPVATVALLSLIHISEPTRLRCISYAVFCLKKKFTTQKKTCKPNSISNHIIGIDSTVNEL